MIGKLKGILDSIEDDAALIDVGGVCYQVFCSGKTLAALPQPGAAAVLLIETVVREDMIRLYGFSNAAEKGWFELLTTVQGVGTRVALSILTVLDPGELASAIALGDKAIIGRANGVGPKLAQRVVAELKGKIPDLGIDPGTIGLQSALGAGMARSNVADAVSALGNLGYGSIQVSAAMARIIAREGEATPTETLIRLGLRELSS